MRRYEAIPVSGYETAGMTQGPALMSESKTVKWEAWPQKAAWETLDDINQPHL